VLGLVGESGCGKSTLGRGILGLLPEGAESDGEVVYGGRNLVTAAPKELRRLRGPDLGLIFQEPMTRLNPLLRIEDHFEETLKRHESSLSKREIRRRSLETLGKMGIPPTRYRQYPFEFSGGMRQRIMIALALVLRPKLLVADEPTTALDVIVEAQILSILADLKREFGTALLLITHNLGIIAEACDRVAVMYAGRIVEEGPARQLFAEPAHPYTRELLRSTISLETTELHSIPGAPPNLIDPPSGCRFHPRCPDVMQVCPRKFPIPVPLEGDRRVECWLHGPADEIPPEGTQPLERERIAIADEA
jgi:oligopeptide/dipeptide ABC transporter ATP-binding protein